VHLKSLTLTGFKSFPDRTRLDFGPGVSVVVGPNGSGKSNVTDAVLWAMGEQSPLAVRGQSMQDVIFAGGRGTRPRSSAEVEIVLDNSDGAVDLPLSEISIARQLDRIGQGTYRINGARCRWGDVIEVLSDTGLGRETHSVISQGRIEQIVTSRPRERRLLIEEAAGLGKHRKRRRRAQLKLERTLDNLDRAMDVEREARSSLRPLKRQAEAAQLHERLERQTLEVRWELVADSRRSRAAELGAAQERVRIARERREEIESRLRVVGERRGRAETALTERGQRHDALAGRLFQARSARERVGLRAEQALAGSELLASRIERLQRELAELAPAPSPAGGGASGRERGSSPAQASEPQPRAAAKEIERALTQAWEQLRREVADGVERARGAAGERPRARVVQGLVGKVERIVAEVVELSLTHARLEGRADAETASAPTGRSERGQSGDHARWVVRLRDRLDADLALAPLARRLADALAALGEAIEAGVVDGARRELERHGAAGEEIAGELRACAREEATIQAELRAAGETVTATEVAAQRVRDQVDDCEQSLREIAERLGRPAPESVLAGGDGGRAGDDRQPARGRGDRAGVAEPAGGLGDAEPTRPEPTPLSCQDIQALELRLARLERRREQLGPVNPLARAQYAEALAHVEELEAHREDLETALRELRALIRDTDRMITETFERTFAATARGFEQLVEDLFPGGSGRLRLVDEDAGPRPVLGGQPLGGADGADDAGEDAAGEPESDSEGEAEPAEEKLQGVEIELTPAGKSTKRLTLLSGGEKALTALAFLFAVFLARPCPFYILDEVEAALDDLNLDRFLELLKRYCDRAQFIVITHQKRTMEVADWLYGVSMAEDGVSRVVSRRLPPAQAAQAAGAAEVGEAAEVA
jgi:chromosome segregation ATPase